MKTALVIGYGQIGQEIASQLTSAGVRTRIATRSAHASEPETPDRVHLRVDATNRDQLREAAEGADVIFACAHAPYDSRIWAELLPRLDDSIMDVANSLDIPVVFPESVYAFAALGAPITEDSDFAPNDEKGRIRQRLIEARQAHPSTSASVIAGDLLGRSAEPSSSVVRLCITEPISHGRRAFAPARTSVAHGITVIADHAAAMVAAADDLEDAPAGTHRLLLAPASNPTLSEIAEFTHDHLGSRRKKVLSLPQWSTRVAGLFDRSMYELNQLAPIWYSPCIIEPGDLAEAVGTTDWRDGVKQML